MVLPAHRKATQGTARLHFLEPCSYQPVDRQAIHQPSHRSQVEGVELHLEACARSRLTAAATVADIGRRQRQVVRRGESQILRCEFHPRPPLFPDQAALDLCKLEFRKIGLQPQLHAREFCICRQIPNSTLGKVHPNPHATHAIRDLQRERKPLAQRGEVRVANLEIKLALPALEVCKRTAADVAAQVDRRGHFQGRDRAQAEAMAGEQFVDAKLHVFEHQRFSSQCLIHPSEIRVAQHDPPLLQQPIGEAALALIVLRQGESGHYQCSVGVTPDLER